MNSEEGDLNLTRLGQIQISNINLLSPKEYSQLSILQQGGLQDVTFIPEKFKLKSMRNFNRSQQNLNLPKLETNQSQSIISNTILTQPSKNSILRNLDHSEMRDSIIESHKNLYSNVRSQASQVNLMLKTSQQLLKKKLDNNTNDVSYLKDLKQKQHDQLVDKELLLNSITFKQSPAAIKIKIDQLDTQSKS